MDAAEALLEYASVSRTDNDRESVQWESAGQTEAIELGDRGRLQIGAQREAIFGRVSTTEGADKRKNGRTDDGTAGTTQLLSDDVAADRGWYQWSTGDILSPVLEPREDGLCIRWNED